jgi:hypothetical protein
MLPIRINASDQVHQGFKCESGSEARPSIAPGLMVAFAAWQHCVAADNLFMKKLTRDRVVPIISTSVS